MTVAEILGINPADVNLICADTDTTPIDLGAYSSRVTFMMGNAAIEAAEKLRKKLFEAVAEELHINERALSEGTESLQSTAGQIVHMVNGVPTGKTFSFLKAVRLAESKFGQLSSTGSYTPQALGGPYKGSGVGPTPAYSYSAAVATVSVDLSLIHI